jgi:hypothetical protein
MLLTLLSLLSFTLALWVVVVLLVRVVTVVVAITRVLFVVLETLPCKTVASRTESTRVMFVTTVVDFVVVPSVRGGGFV